MGLGSDKGERSVSDSKECPHCKKGREQGKHYICWFCGFPSFPNLQALKDAEWEECSSVHYFIYELEHEGAKISIESRNSYCDRGHWLAKVEGIISIDDSDFFPRFYMDIEVAQKEMKEWLIWRLYKETPYTNYTKPVQEF
jgi:hypothetical protein